MPSPEITRRMSSFGLFLLPLIVVKLASSVVSGPAPTAANAKPVAVIDPATAAAGATASARVEWSAQQRAAAEHVRQLEAEPFGPPPMLYVAKAAAPRPEVDETPKAQPPRDPDVPQFTLQAVMAAPAGDKALINGRLYLVGQAVQGVEWTVREINTSKRSVILAEVNGQRTVTVAVQRRE